jgi:hypothetical protein
LPPPATVYCRSIADRPVVFNASPKTRKSQIYAGVDNAQIGAFGAR